MNAQPTNCARHVSAALRPILADSTAAWAHALRVEGTNSSLRGFPTSGIGSLTSNDMDRHMHRSARCIHKAFESFLCALPARVGDDLRPADWAFGADPPSVGKLVGRFALQLYLSSTVPAHPFRHVLPTEVLTGWRWRPSENCQDGDKHESWLRADVCRADLRRQDGRGQGGELTGALRNHRRGGPPRNGRSHSGHSPRASLLGTGLDDIRVGSTLLRVARGNSSGRWERRADPYWMATAGGGVTTPGLWLAAQAVRRVWRYAPGACTRQRVAPLLRAPYARLTSRRRLAVAMHIRRGDSCEHWVGADSSVNRKEAARGRPGGEARRQQPPPRPCFAAQAYLAQARQMLNSLRIQQQWPSKAASPPVQPAWLLVATDSASALAELRDLIDPAEFELLHADGPRGAQWGGAPELINLGLSRQAAQREFIETRNERGLVDRAAVVASFFADVELLSLADAFVGTAASWTSRIYLLAIIGEKGLVPPFAMVDRPLGQVWFA